MHPEPLHQRLGSNIRRPASVAPVSRRRLVASPPARSCPATRGRGRRRAASDRPNSSAGRAREGISRDPGTLHRVEERRERLRGEAQLRPVELDVRAQSRDPVRRQRGAPGVGFAAARSAPARPPRAQEAAPTVSRPCSRSRKAAARSVAACRASRVGASAARRPGRTRRPRCA